MLVVFFTFLATLIGYHGISCLLSNQFLQYKAHLKLVTLVYEYFANSSNTVLSMANIDKGLENARQFVIPWLWKE